MNIIEIKQIIKEFGISMPKLAEKTGMSDSSFKKKISENYKNQFNKQELKKLENAVLDLKNKINVCM